MPELTYKLYTGIITVMETVSELVRNQHNESCYGWYTSEKEALGDWIIKTSAKHPNLPIVCQCVYDITEAVDRNPNA